MLAWALERELPPRVALHFADRITVFLTSSDERRIGQWEHVAWSDFLRAEEFGGDYQRVFSELFSHFLQASRADMTSTKFAGTIFEAALYSFLGVSSPRHLFSVLDGPTSETWIDPWISLLADHGVDLRLGCRLRRFALRDGLVTAARVDTPHGSRWVHADHYICALPVERAVEVWDHEVIRADPRLAEMRNLRTGWMSGIQLYLSHQTPLTNGHVVYFDSPWAISGISQAQFWPGDFRSQFGDGRVGECMSAVEPGLTAAYWAAGRATGKAARDCTTVEIVFEVWEEMKRHINDQGDDELTDDLLLSWHLDPGMKQRPQGGFDFEDPLVLPTVAAWPSRPEARSPRCSPTPPSWRGARGSHVRTRAGR